MAADWFSLNNFYNIQIELNRHTHTQLYTHGLIKSIQQLNRFGINLFVCVFFSLLPCISILLEFVLAFYAADSYFKSCNTYSYVADDVICYRLQCSNLIFYIQMCNLINSKIFWLAEHKVLCSKFCHASNQIKWMDSENYFGTITKSLRCSYIPCMFCYSN